MSVAGSESFSVVVEELLIGRQEQKFLLALSQMPEEKVLTLVGLAKELFPELRNLSDFEIGIIALGYVKGQREFNVRAYFAAAGGQVEAYDRVLALEENEGKRQALQESFQEKETEKRKRGRRRKNL